MRRPSSFGQGGSSGPGKPGPIFTRTTFPGNVDPNYGILGVEKAATSTWQPGSISAKVIRRRNTRRKLQEPLDVTTTPVVGNTSRTAGIPFTTRTTPSRKHKSVGWLAAMASAVATPVPVAAWLRRASITRVVRRPLKRRLLVAPSMQWQSASNLMAARLQPPKARYIKYERKLRQNRFADLYPQITPTGPPPDAWKLAAVRVVSQRRRLLRLPWQPVYPATLYPPQTVELLKALRRRELRRKLRRLADAPVYPAPVVYASLVLNKARRTEQKRRLLTLAQPSYPPTPAGPSVPFAALQVKERKRRKARQGLFFGGGSGSELSAPPVTPALYPSFVPKGYLRRKDTKRRLVRALVPPVYPATPAPSVSPDRTLQEAFVTRQVKSRRLITAPAVLNVAAAPPVTTPAVYASLVQNKAIRTSQKRVRLTVIQPSYPVTPPPPPQPITAIVASKAIRRKARRGLFLTDLGGIVQPAQPLAAWIPPKQHKTRIDRKLRVVPLLLVYPPTPSTPPQPEPSFKRPRQFFKTQIRKRIEAQPQITYPPTPAPTNVMRVWIGAGTVIGTGTRVFIKG